MKKYQAMSYRIQIFVLFLLVVLKSFGAMAAPLQAIKQVDPEKYRWLYELLIPADDRLRQPAEAFKSFRVHLVDSDENFPEPNAISAAYLNLKESIQGKITYIGFIPKRYQYDVLYGTNSNDVTLRVKVHFKNPEGQDLENLKLKMIEAEQIWNSHQVALDFKYQFQFQIVDDPSEAHFSVQLLDSTRGPYDTNWSRKWSGISIAHELGHMLGLGDEYQTISSVSDCLPLSIMCESDSASPMWQHYYFILRRLMK